MKNEHAVSLAKLRAKSLTPERRKEIASNAAKEMWRIKRLKALSTGTHKDACASTESVIDCV